MYHDWYYIPDGVSEEQLQRQEIEQWAMEQETIEFAKRLQSMNFEQALQIAHALMAANEAVNHPNRGLEKLNETLGDCDVQFPELV